MFITTIAIRLFEQILLDIIGPITKSIKHNSYILTFKDDLTKFTATFPLVTHEANSVAKYFALESSVTDYGTEVQSRIFKEFCKLLRQR